MGQWRKFSFYGMASCTSTCPALPRVPLLVIIHCFQLQKPQERPLLSLCRYIIEFSYGWWLEFDFISLVFNQNNSCFFLLGRQCGVRNRSLLGLGLNGCPLVHFGTNAHFIILAILWLILLWISENCIFLYMVYTTWKSIFIVCEFNLFIVSVSLMCRREGGGSHLSTPVTGASAAPATAAVPGKRRFTEQVWRVITTFLLTFTNCMPCHHYIVNPFTTESRYAASSLHSC